MNIKIKHYIEIEMEVTCHVNPKQIADGINPSYDASIADIEVKAPFELDFEDLPADDQDNIEQALWDEIAALDQGYDSLDQKRAYEQRDHDRLMAKREDERRRKEAQDAS